jgi:cytochrome c-type biogenesis protein CcmH/NrfG
VDSKIIIGTAAGLAVGLGVGYYMGGQKPPIVLPAPAPAAAAPAGGGFGVVPQPGQLGGGAPAGMPAGMPAMPPPGAQGGAHAARIQHNEHLVKSDPKNLQAWIELGNDYFDTHDPQRSIAAYAKALALDPKNPNVLTDQGVMYRQVGEFQKALANFEKAAKLDPNHAQSRYNQGIVLSQDLKKPDLAAKVWTQLVQAMPNSPQAELARRGLEALTAPR